MALAQFSAEDRRSIFKAVEKSPALLSRLLNRQLPPQMLAILEDRRIRLFPRGWRDMKAHCSCPDWALPCKHIAAVIYLIANEIDKNPFLVFELHGMDLADALQARAGAHPDALLNLPVLSECWCAEPIIGDFEPPPADTFSGIDLSSVPVIERRGLIFKLLNALKQICNSPAQFLKHESASIEASGKLSAFMEIMREVEASDEKALIFTQYTTMGELLTVALRDELRLEIPFLHGGLSRKRRDDLVDSFQKDRGVRAMVLSLKAGGTGLNLTAASQVIHYDLWWNPAVERQATDRAYRIGQRRDVMVHRLITENTFEERIDAMIQSKKELAELTVSSGEQWLTELSNEELRALVSL